MVTANLRFRKSQNKLFNVVISKGTTVNVLIIDGEISDFFKLCYDTAAIMQIESLKVNDIYVSKFQNGDSIITTRIA